MNRKGLSVGLILLLIGTSIIPITAQNAEKSLPSSRGNWLYVGGSGPGNYTRIQDAIDNTSNGDTVYVYDDLSPYYEFISIHKSIILVGEDKSTTIVEDINNQYAGTIQVHSNSVIIKSFTIKNNQINDEGILGDYTNILTITDVIIETKGNGITLYNCNNSIINYNTLISCDWFGIQIAGGSFNTITNCNLINNLHAGIYIQSNVSNNIIYHNNFINNTINACDAGSNIWDNGYPSGGNYWDDYAGVDNNGDGIGDIPYNISYGSNQDLYPFMEPSGWLNQPPNPPIIEGPSQGIINVNYTFCVTWTNSDAHDFYFMWDWGDGNISEWLGPFAAGQTICSNHTWSQKGTYEILVKLKDEHGVEIVSDPHIFNVYELNKALIFGRYTNLTEEGENIIIETANLWLIFFNPFQYIHYVNGEMITLDNNSPGWYMVMHSLKFIIGFNSVIFPN